MIAYKFPTVRARLGQPPMPVMTPPTPPDPDFTFTGFIGLPGTLETVAILLVSASAMWAGLRMATEEKNTYLKTAGWVGGIGSGLLGLLYLGAKTGVGQIFGLPAVRVSPA